MSVYMGEDGGLMIKRTAVGQGLLRSQLDPGDVNVARKRFSFDFPVEALITGDRIEIFTADGSNLTLVDGHNFPDGLWHCHIDDAGGVRLYDEFEDAINGGPDKAVALIEPPAAQQILVRTRNSRFRCYAQMKGWEFTTSRQQVDTTTLGEEFVTQFARGLISGQGSATCIWDYKNSLCDPMGDHSESEMPHYLCELLLRLKQGALFRGQFYLHQGEPSVWYEADCIVTNAAMNFVPGTVIQSQVQFVTTGTIDLHTGQPDGFTLTESGDLVLQENLDGILLEDSV